MLPSLGYTKDLSSPVLEVYISVRIGLAGRQGVNESDNQGAGWVCQTSNYQARICAKKATWLS